MVTNEQIYKALEDMQIHADNGDGDAYLKATEEAFNLTLLHAKQQENIAIV